MKWLSCLLLLRSDVKLYEQLLPAVFALTVKDVSVKSLCRFVRMKLQRINVSLCQSLDVILLPVSIQHSTAQYSPSYTAAQTDGGQVWLKYCVFLQGDQ